MEIYVIKVVIISILIRLEYYKVIHKKGQYSEKKGKNKKK